MEEWRRKASECRAIAEQMNDPAAMASFEQLAQAYERRAAMAQRRMVEAYQRSMNAAEELRAQGI